MKRILAVILVACMVFSLAACGGKKETEKATEKATTAETQAVVEETVTEAVQAVETEAAEEESAD